MPERWENETRETLRQLVFMIAGQLQNDPKADLEDIGLDLEEASEIAFYLNKQEEEKDNG